jgi:hypothetical protein
MVWLSIVILRSFSRTFDSRLQNVLLPERISFTGVDSSPLIIIVMPIRLCYSIATEQCVRGEEHLTHRQNTSDRLYARAVVAAIVLLENLMESINVVRNLNRDSNTTLGHNTGLRRVTQKLSIC